MEVQTDQVLKDLTWYKVGGPADRLYFPESVEDLIEIVRTEKDWTVLGAGSNVLVCDKGIRGATVCTRKMTHLESSISEDGKRLIIEAQSGVPKSQLTKEFLKHKLAPALFLSGIPGDTGGGVFMNAGVSEQICPREFCEIVDMVKVVDPSGEVRELSSDQLNWSYRHCDGFQPGIIAAAILSWPMEPVLDLVKQVRAASKSRLARQPLEFPSCGSVFVNPVGGKSGQLIESCGLKGYTIGGAQVSTKHANFIINTGNATAADIWSVITHVQKTVKSRTGFDLKTEVRRLGDWV